jgi:dTMP kinase
MAPRGRLIALEGIDGCGKSTQARLLANALGARLTFEPGATPLGMRLRELLLAPDTPRISARAEALLMSADRAEHVASVLGPALADGEWVVSDRYAGSTLAYQGAGRGLAVSELAKVLAFAMAGVTADLSVLVDVPIEVAAARLAAADTRPGGADRMEGQGPGFASRVRSGFLEQAAGDPDRWVIVDGEERVETVAARILSVVRERLGDPPAPTRARR